MDEESMKISVTPEITEPDGGNLSGNSRGKPGSPNCGQYRRASIGSCHDGGSSRRISTSKLSSPSSGDNILPHYLRASTGSCHDFCKYGRNHSFVVKARHPLPKRITAAPSDKQNKIGAEIPDGSKKKMVVKLKPFPDSKTLSPKPPELVKWKILLPSKKVLKPSPDSKTQSPKPPEVVKQEILLPSKKVEVFSKQDLSHNKERTEIEMKMTPSTKHSPSVKLRPVMLKPLSSFDASIALNGRRNSDKKMTEDEMKMNPSTKHSHSVKPRHVMLKPSSSSDASIGLKGRRNIDIKLAKKTVTPKAAVKKVLAPPTASLLPKSSISGVASLNVRKYRSLKLVPPLRDQNRFRKAELKQPNGDTVQEKTLHVVEAETENKILEPVQNGGIIQSLPSPSLPLPKSSSHPNTNSLLLSSNGEDLEEYEYTDSEADDFGSENDETVIINEVDTSNGVYNRTPRKGGVVLSEDKDCSLVKLKFRRGKVVDLQCESNAPRRLRFRQGRVFGDNEASKSDSRKRSFKKRVIDNDTNSTRPNSERVSLRHQDVQGKKDARGLFNNVIEETASKLVESRKSKVKALVGAFETVISLQENKPSSQAVT